MTFDNRMIVVLQNYTVASNAVLSRWLYNFKAIGEFADYMLEF